MPGPPVIVIDSGLDAAAPGAIDITSRPFAGRATLGPAFDPDGNRMRKAKGARP
jgi:hypothetical protein